MRANTSTAQADKSTSTDSDDLPGTSTTRRRLLGGAAALATIPATASATPDDDPDAGTNATAEDTGPRRTSTGTLSGVWSATELGEEHDEDAEISTVGYHYEDEPSQVEVWVSTRPARTCLNLSVEETRDLARRLLEAADAAEGDL